MSFVFSPQGPPGPKGDKVSTWFIRDYADDQLFILVKKKICLLACVEEKHLRETIVSGGRVSDTERSWFIWAEARQSATSNQNNSLLLKLL